MVGGEELEPPTGRLSDARDINPLLCQLSYPPDECSTTLKLGGARRVRTDDLMLAKHPLSQLSYGPKFVVGRTGFEPVTNGLKVRCSTS